MSLSSLFRRREAGPGEASSAPRAAPATEAGTPFHRCAALFGEANLLPERLRLLEYSDVLLLGSVLYDDRRQLISDSAFFRGVPRMEVRDAPPDTGMVPARAPNRLPPGRWFWIGPFHPHFGHYLVSTLSRFWALPAIDAASFTFLYVGGETPEQIFTRPYMRETLAALGLSPSQLRRVDGPLFIPSITVAQPSLLENYGASPAYAATLRRIRDALLPGGVPNAERPVYISKQRVPGGVRGVGNEEAVTAILRREGVEIACPDTLPFRDQVAFWCGHAAAAGFASSAFHMAGFGGGKRLCTISHDHLASPNQVLIDRLAGNEHLYLHAGPGLVSLGADSRFTDVMSVVDPPGFARGVIDILDRLGNLPGQRQGPEPRSVWPDALTYEPFGTELARAGRATQSSDYEIDEGRHRTAEGALSGRLTGAYQCSTRCEEQPWWQVELPAPSRIYEVRIFNRTETQLVQDRLAGFRLSVSEDGAEWRVVHVHDGPAPGPAPFRWQAHATTLARFVRIALPGFTWLHLDQVEVFGEGVAAPG